MSPRPDRRRSDMLLALGAALVTAVAVAVVVVLHVRGDRARQAQVRVEQIDTAANLLGTVPLVALYESFAQGEQLLTRSDAAIKQQLALLPNIGTSGDLARIRSTAAGYSADLAGILPLMRAFEQQGGKRVALLPDPRSVPGYSQIQERFVRESNALKEAIASAEGSYASAAREANIEAYIGSAAAVLLACLGFSAVLHLLSRSRGQAQTLADENARLLARTRVEAETDALTGLPNRRKLMTDLEHAIGQLEPSQRLLLALYDLDGFKYYNDNFGHPAGDRLLARLGQQLAHESEAGATAYRMGGDEFCLVWHDDGSDPATVLDRASQALSDNGSGFSISASHGSAAIPDEAQTIEQALHLADQRLYTQKAFSPIRGTSQARDVLLQALLERNPELEPHLSRVAELSEQLARRLSFTESEVARVRLAAQLHDIGKVAIPETILKKPGPLSDEEWRLIKQHTLIGERIVGAAGELSEVARLIRHSHERIDGTGYPDGLSGDAIPLAARIITACDAYDAMTSERPYRPALTSREALDELTHAAGTHLDPVVVEHLVALLTANNLHKHIAA